MRSGLRGPQRSALRGTALRVHLRRPAGGGGARTRPLGRGPRSAASLRRGSPRGFCRLLLSVALAARHGRRGWSRLLTRPAARGPRLTGARRVTLLVVGTHRQPEHLREVGAGEHPVLGWSTCREVCPAGRARGEVVLV